MDADTLLSSLLDANAAALDLAIAPEHRSGVLAYLALARGMYLGLQACELGPVDESALIFMPQGPESTDG